MEMYKKYIILFCLISLSFSQIELSKALIGEQIIKHSGFTLSYNEKHEQALWSRGLHFLFGPGG